MPLRFDTIRLVQNRCSFHEHRSKDPNQHLKDFLKLVDSLDLDVANRERTRLRLFQFSIRDQASNWLECLPAGSISTWKVLTTCFLAQLFLTGRTTKLQNGVLMFQQHQGESLSEAWARFKDLLQKVPHHGIDLWLQVKIFYDRIDYTLKRTVDYAARGRNLINAEEWRPMWADKQYNASTTTRDITSGRVRSSREISSVDEPKPQILPNFSPSDINLRDKRGPDPPIKPHSPDSFRMKVVEKSTINIPPSPHVASFHPKDAYCYYHPCIDDPKKHYGFKLVLLRQSGS
nr:zinc finger, CCHC-type [Tanacetum cinerariifolium]